MKSLKMDTNDVDNEVDALRKIWSDGSLGVQISKLTGTDKYKPANTLGLNTAYAFSHVDPFDDSRGPYANLWLVGPAGTMKYGRDTINTAEVLYNEARGEPYLGRQAVAWAIRNRANINMNGCDYYPGAKGHGGVNACKAATPIGPQPAFADAYKRYSCVIHGGTAVIGASHSQMDDSHVSLSALESSGLLWIVTSVYNGWAPDRTSSGTPSGTFYTGAISPYISSPGQLYFTIESTLGNPAGAQEWRSINYCAQNSQCKVRLGNVGGNLADPGNPCPGSGGSSSDNFFWGRKP